MRKRRCDDSRPLRLFSRPIWEQVLRKQLCGPVIFRTNTFLLMEIIAHEICKRQKITSSHTAEVLIEAFPWIKNATGKTVLIKYGGAAMVDPALRHAVMSDIVMLKIMG